MITNRWQHKSGITAILSAVTKWIKVSVEQTIYYILTKFVNIKINCNMEFPLNHLVNNNFLDRKNVVNAKSSS